jgi:hypothetical protein
MEVSMGQSIRSFGTPLVALLLASAALTGTTTTAQSNRVAHFTAFAINMNNTGRGRNTATVDIIVNRWSTDAERDKLFDAVKEARRNTQNQLLSVVQNMPSIGRIRTPDGVGYDLRFARLNPVPDGGERINILTDRPVGFWEASNRPRVNDFPFTVIELHMPKDGRGEGKLMLATQITFNADTKTVTLEHYETQPVMLNEVRRLTS